MFRATAKKLRHNREPHPESIAARLRCVRRMPQHALAMLRRAASIRRHAPHHEAVFGAQLSVRVEHDMEFDNSFECAAPRAWKVCSTSSASRLHAGASSPSIGNNTTRARSACGSPVALTSPHRQVRRDRQRQALSKGLRAGTDARAAAVPMRRRLQSRTAAADRSAGAHQLTLSGAVAQYGAASASSRRPRRRS